MLKSLFITITALLLNVTTNAQTLKVAVAANLQSVIKVLDSDFKQRSGITIEPIIGSSGKLVAQISNGAPYDVFLSADMEYPQKLFKDGFSIKPPVVYALGSLIICDYQEMELNAWPQILQRAWVTKIAIANPKLAPYGRAAEEVLNKLKLMPLIKSKLVYGESIAQVNNYMRTGVANVGFTTQALAVDAYRLKEFHWQVINPELYSPIQQGMVVIKHKDGKNYIKARRFYQYMLSMPAKNILKKYGYIIP